MKRFFLSLLALCLTSLVASAQEKAPDLEYVCELLVACDQAYSCGTNPRGDRVIIPIKGGTFEGPKMKGKVLPGGADYQLQDKAHNHTALEAIYSIQTDDGVNIHIRNCGIISQGKDANGNPSFYFRTAPKFEAPYDSKYAWLNDAIFVCVPGFKDGMIQLKVWKVL